MKKLNLLIENLAFVWLLWSQGFLKGCKFYPSFTKDKGEIYTLYTDNKATFSIIRVDVFHNKFKEIICHEIGHLKFKLENGCEFDKECYTSSRLNFKCDKFRDSAILDKVVGYEEEIYASVEAILIMKSLGYKPDISFLHKCLASYIPRNIPQHLKADWSNYGWKKFDQILKGEI